MNWQITADGKTYEGISYLRHQPHYLCSWIVVVQFEDSVEVFTLEPGNKDASTEMLRYLSEQREDEHPVIVGDYKRHDHEG